MLNVLRSLHITGSFFNRVTLVALISVFVIGCGDQPVVDEDAGGIGDVLTLDPVTGITLVNPTASPSLNPSPTIEVAGVASGELIEAHFNSECSSLAASETASGETVQITVAGLSTGTYSLYARRVDSETGSLSPCSSMSAAYEVIGSSLSVTGLSDDSTPTQSKTWTWGCSGAVSSCEYRFAINTSAGFSFGSEPYGSTKTTSQGSVTGVYYLHVQARDVSFPSVVSNQVSVSVPLDNTPPAAPSTLVMQDPASSTGSDDTPSIQVSGLNSGDTVNLYSDACTTSIGSGLASGSSIIITSAPLVDGSYTFYADSLDSVGNRSSCSTATASYTLSTAPPLAPTALSLEAGLNPVDNDDTPGIEVSGLVAGNTVTVYSDASCSISVGSAIASGTSAVVNLNSLADGTYSFYADSTNVASASSPCSSASVSYVLDTVLPVVAITSAPDITAANQASYQVVGTCSESGLAVTLNIGSLLVNTTCSSGSFSSGLVSVAGQADSASFAITADQTDSAGNSANQASVTVSKDTASDLVAITNSPDIDNANELSYSVSGTCSGNGSPVNVAIDSLSFSTNCASGVWNLGNLNVSSLADSVLSVTADHLTAPQASANINKDSSAPTVVISSAPNMTTANQSNYFVSGTCSENGQNVDVSIGGTVNLSLACSSGSWTTGQQDVSGLADSSSITITADHQSAGAVPANQAVALVSKNTATPVVTNLSAPSTLTNSVDLNWDLVDPGGFTINDYEIQYRAAGTSTWLNFNDGVSTTSSATVDNLQAATTYEFQVRVSYDLTSSDYSPAAQGTTKPDNPVFDSPYKAMNVGGATTTNVVAYYDDTYVTLNGVTIPESPLSKGESVNLTTVQFDVIDADQPIFTAGRRGSGGNTSKANVVWSPTFWAGKTFSFNAIRDNSQELYVFATEDAEVEVRQGASVLAAATLSANGNATLIWSQYGSYQVVSTGTILAYHTSTRNGTRLVDPKPLLPSSNEIIGVPSSSMRLTTDSNGTNYTFFHSNSTSGSAALNTSEVDQISPQGTSNQYNPSSLLIFGDKPVAGASFADSDGNCAAPFVPTNLMKTKYVINVVAEWVAFASKEAGTISVYSPTQTIGIDTPVATLSLANSGGDANAPFKARMANPASGYRFVSDVPMAGWYEPNTDTGAALEDETVLYGTD